MPTKGERKAVEQYLFRRKTMSAIPVTGTEVPIYWKLVGYRTYDIRGKCLCGNAFRSPHVNHFNKYQFGTWLYRCHECGREYKLVRVQDNAEKTDDGWVHAFTLLETVGEHVPDKFVKGEYQIGLCVF